MPNRPARKSVVDMLAKVPVNKGSLLKSIENLLKTIESSESAVMIPTLLRDKCEFDAWELLFVSKILKASILGHSDLVEFYMNHFGQSAIQLAQQNGINNTMGQYGIEQQQASPTSSAGLGGSLEQNVTSASTNGHLPTTLSASPSLSSNSSSSSSTRTNNFIAKHLSSPTASVNWTNSVSSSVSSTTMNDSSSSSGLMSSSTLSQDSCISEAPTLAATGIQDPAIEQDSLFPTRPITLRQPQPPSLLQLTTTNNHINSVAAVSSGFTNNSIEQLTNQLTAMQANGCLSGSHGATPSLDAALSISTHTANQQSSATASNGTPTPTTTERAHPPELRTSRSAGCLFRINSGASSPRTPAQTPTTPYPQAETLADRLSNGLLVDPGAPVKLLLQIEQLKSSISHVTNLLESVVELYKKSIDNIA